MSRKKIFIEKIVTQTENEESAQIDTVEKYFRDSFHIYNTKNTQEFKIIFNIESSHVSN